jgi:hypothetical protein
MKACDHETVDKQHAKQQNESLLVAPSHKKACALAGTCQLTNVVALHDGMDLL